MGKLRPRDIPGDPTAEPGFEFMSVCLQSQDDQHCSVFVGKADAKRKITISIHLKVEKHAKVSELKLSRRCQKHQKRGEIADGKKCESLKEGASPGSHVAEGSKGVGTQTILEGC